jgi:Tol biopolymer transport system component
VFTGYQPGATSPDLYAAEPDGSGVRTLLAGLPAPVTGASWAPDATAVAVASGGLLQTVGAEGGSTTTLFEGPTLVNAVAWSPAGDWIAYAVGGEGNTQAFQRYKVHLVRPDGTEDHAVADLESDGSRVTWAPDGRWVAFAAYFGGRLDLVAVPVAGGAPRRLTQRPQSASAPDWSPDCTRIAFVDGSVGGDDLAVLALDGTRVTTLVATRASEPPTNVRTPVWSPTGDHVAMYLELPDVLALPHPELAVSDVGGHLRQLTGNQDGTDDGLTWSTDGLTVFYATIGEPPPGQPNREDGTGWTLWSVGVAGADRIQLQPGPEDPHHPVLATAD